FTIAHEEQLYKTMEFQSWASRHDDTMQTLLRAMLAQVAPEVKAALQPQGTGAGLTFRLCEGLFINRRALPPCNETTVTVSLGVRALALDQVSATQRFSGALRDSFGCQSVQSHIA